MRQLNLALTQESSAEPREVLSERSQAEIIGAQLSVVTFLRGAPRRVESSPSQLSAVHHHDQPASLREELFYAKSFGESLRGGLPDWLTAHKLSRLVALPINALHLWLAYRRALKASARLSSRPKSHADDSERLLSPTVIAHWAIPCGIIASKQEPIVYCHGGDVALLESLVGGHLLARYISAHARGVICVSADLQRRWNSLVERGNTSSRPRAPSFTLPMGICAPAPCPQSRERFMEMRGERFCIITVGRLVPIKGYHLLVGALSGLSDEERAQVCWFAAGSGPERDQLRAHATEISAPLTLLGELAPPTRDALLSVGDLFIAPSVQLGSRVEGAPLAMREAALSGCPVITTSLGGAGELAQALPPQAVRICEPTVESLLGCLREALHGHFDAQLSEVERDSMRRELSATAYRLWSWDHLGPQHASLISELI